GRPRRARLFRGAAHVLGERLRVLPRHDAGDRRGFARRQVDRTGESVGARPDLRRRGREPLGRVPPGGVPGARRRAQGRRGVLEQSRLSRVLQGVVRLGARLRRRLRLLGRARLDGACARRYRGPDALDVPLLALRRAVRRPGARWLRATCERHGVRSQLWLPSFGLTKEEIPEFEAAIGAAREEGIDDLWTWGYEACGFMTHLATPDSPLVWEAVSAALTGS